MGYTCVSDASHAAGQPDNKHRYIGRRTHASETARPAWAGCSMRQFIARLPRRDTWPRGYTRVHCMLHMAGGTTGVTRNSGALGAPSRALPPVSLSSLPLPLPPSFPSFYTPSPPSLPSSFHLPSYSQPFPSPSLPPLPL